jgi:hypothetical protein
MTSPWNFLEDAVAGAGVDSLGSGGFGCERTIKESSSYVRPGYVTAIASLALWGRRSSKHFGHMSRRSEQTRLQAGHFMSRFLQTFGHIIGDAIQQRFYSTIKGLRMRLLNYFQTMWCGYPS